MISIRVCVHNISNIHPYILLCFTIPIRVLQSQVALEEAVDGGRAVHWCPLVIYPFEYMTFIHKIGDFSSMMPQHMQFIGIWLSEIWMCSLTVSDLTDESGRFANRHKQSPYGIWENHFLNGHGPETLLCGEWCPAGRERSWWVVSQFVAAARVTPFKTS